MEKMLKEKEQEMKIMKEMHRSQEIEQRHRIKEVKTLRKKLAKLEKIMLI